MWSKQSIDGIVKLIADETVLWTKEKTLKNVDLQNVHSRRAGH